ncbi:PREDICTED: uncharacterized protein LOC109232499 [Nicotiana attenuata]|uniref:uncharacterized protein LOC109232499 n=1 Tax=Nicotiana attenuata TaxID=49451 RepID=UPI000904F4B8|nr:PREDICTED: uncharacterized protein LOC109232499 [Nicotiana attenuata]
MAWKSFDELHPSFASEPRNVRLGLASDGFQPFRNSKTSYSIWPVVLIPYNLPPWLCMKQENFILSMLIPGPNSPGDAIDIYLQPLIEELKELWEVGIVTFDASSKQNFKLHASLLWTINDFPAYGNLSGWSTKGKLACPYCNKDTSSIRLANSKKQCFMGHRHYLPLSHKWRNDKDSFDGTKEKRLPPKMQSGIEILNQVQDLEGIQLTNDPKKKKKISHENRKDNWNKKNHKISGLKSHDCHVLLQHILPLALRGMLSKEVCEPLIELSLFFNVLGSRELRIDDLKQIEAQIPITLCKLEKVFPPSFFDVMVHLPIHLASEAKIAGPIHYRWMYPVERWLYFLKSLIGNRACPEGSIAEGYIANECMTLCSREFAQTHVDTAQHLSDAEWNRQFIDWFKVRVAQLHKEDDSQIMEDLLSLSRGPTQYTTYFNGYIVNGYRFHVEDYDKNLRTHNCGVVVVGENDKDRENIDYNGILTDVIELQFLMGRRVILFRCNWFNMKPSKIENDVDSNMKSTTRYAFVPPAAIRKGQGRGRGRGLRSLVEKENMPIKSLFPQSSDLVKQYIQTIETSAVGKGRGQGFKSSTMSASQGPGTIRKDSIVLEKEYMQIDSPLPPSTDQIKQYTQKVEASFCPSLKDNLGPVTVRRYGHFTMEI